MTGPEHDQAQPTQPQAPADGPQAVTLAKGRHSWTFVCAPGDHERLLARVADLARDGTVPLDWFDAALIRHQLSGRLRSGINRVDKTTENSGMPEPRHDAGADQPHGAA
ncbi:MAG TPA: hypothetical protein VD963_04390 [Phycisphaerales bacterium]|nr:hypothetical protein [Phycisphaerales bacterium]